MKFDFFFKLQGFCKEEYSILCTIQSSEVVFGSGLECQLRKSFVDLKMNYNSKNVRAVAESVQVKRTIEGACQKSC